MGALSLLCHGASLCGAEHGFGADVQGNGHQRRTNHLLDVVDYDAMDTEILVEPVLRDVQNEEVLCRSLTVNHGCGLRFGRFGSAFAPLLHPLYCAHGHHCL